MLVSLCNTVVTSSTHSSSCDRVYSWYNKSLRSVANNQVGRLHRSICERCHVLFQVVVQGGSSVESLHSCSSWCHVVGPSAGTLTLRSSCYVLQGQRQWIICQEWIFSVKRLKSVGLSQLCRFHIWISSIHCSKVKVVV